VVNSVGSQVEHAYTSVREKVESLQNLLLAIAAQTRSAVNSTVSSVQSNIPPVIQTGLLEVQQRLSLAVERARQLKSSAYNYESQLAQLSKDYAFLVQTKVIAQANAISAVLSSEDRYKAVVGAIDEARNSVSQLLEWLTNQTSAETAATALSNGDSNTNIHTSKTLKLELQPQKLTIHEEEKTQSSH